MAASANKRSRRRRCPACNELFRPHPRVADSQRYCSAEPCQRARKRDYQRRFRAAHPANEGARHLRKRIAEALDQDPSPGPSPPPHDPLATIAWDEITAEMRAPRAFLLEHLARRLLVPQRGPPPRSADIEVIS